MADWFAVPSGELTHTAEISHALILTGRPERVKASSSLQLPSRER